MRIKQYDVVRIDAIKKDLSNSHCCEPISQPAVGEEATIVEELADDVFILENVNNDGETLWLIEVSTNDVSLVAVRNLESPKSSIGQ